MVLHALAPYQYGAMTFWESHLRVGLLQTTRFKRSAGVTAAHFPHRVDARPMGVQAA